MKHQLEVNDAVKCENVEQWAEVIRLAAVHKIYIDALSIFDYARTLSFDENFKLVSGCEEELYAPPDFNFHTFQDFCAKIKGEYEEEEYFFWREVDDHGFLSTRSNLTRWHDIPIGKYKLVRVEE